MGRCQAEEWNGKDQRRTKNKSCCKMSITLILLESLWIFNQQTGEDAGLRLESTSLRRGKFGLLFLLDLVCSLGLGGGKCALSG